MTGNQISIGRLEPKVGSRILNDEGPFVAPN